MPDLENKKEDLTPLNPKKDKNNNDKPDDGDVSDSGDDSEDSDDDSSDGGFSDNNSDEASNVETDDKEDKPRFIKIIKDDTEFDEAMDDETRVRLLSNTRDDLVKTNRKISEIINDDGQQEKDLRKFEAEKEVKKTVATKKDLKQQQRTKIDILRRVSDLFFGDKNKIPSNSVANNQKRLQATGLTANDVTVKDKQLKHKIADEKHHSHHHDEHESKLSFADKIRLQQEQHNHGHNDGGRNM
jgi:hypothetical protein